MADIFLSSNESVDMTTTQVTQTMSLYNKCNCILLYIWNELSFHAFFTQTENPPYKQKTTHIETSQTTSFILHLTHLHIDSQGLYIKIKKSHQN